MKKLTASQIKTIKEIFDEEPSKKLLAIQGHISTLMELSYKIGEKADYSIVSRNLKQLL